jgi:type I restriction enzyme R subunit
MSEMTGAPPEARARVLIDAQLAASGWFVCDRREMDLVNHVGVAVREVPLGDAGRADYLLYVGRKAVGVVEAKPVGTPLTGVEWQSARYAAGMPPEIQIAAVLAHGRLPFQFEASGTETKFTNGYDPEPASRALFAFPRPETLARIIRDAAADPEAPTWRGKVTRMPSLDGYDLRPASERSIVAIEASMAAGKPRSLVQMATGAGKTRMSVAECYRLLKFGGVNRVLFLVDRNNLADQTLREFRDWTTPDDGRKFTDLYNVDKLTSSGMVGSSKVVISTIQRVWSVLKGHEVPDSDDPGIDEFMPDTPVEVQYNPLLPPETFDLVIVDECHRSIYGLWRGVIEYFDAHIVGLTATPMKQTFGFFHQNLVSEYTYAQSVADGVNVDFDVYRIKTEITENGSTIEAGSVIPVMDKRTRAQRLEAIDEDVLYGSTELDRKVMSRDQIRTILTAYKDRLFTEIFPGRSVVPKTLIFAKDDNHAEEIVRQAREIFGKGNDFAAKITYNAQDPRGLLQQFRNSSTLRIAVTVDMIATGTDVKPIECVFFMRDVRSAAYFEQMKGRGARTIDNATFQTLTPDATSKDRFVIIDAVGVTEHEYVDAAPLQRDRAVTLKALLDKAATFTITADETATLASRLARLERQLTPAERAEITDVAGRPLTQITASLITVTDPDAVAAAVAIAPTGPDGQPDEAAAIRALVERAIEPLAGNPTLRQRLLELRVAHDLLIDESSQDTLLDASGHVDRGRAEATVTSWKEYLDQNRDEIAAIQAIYSQPKTPKVAYSELRDLAERIGRPPHRWTVDNLWAAYEAIDPDTVHHSPRHTTTDLVALIRYALGYDNELVPYASTIEDRWANWLAQQAQAGTEFADSEMWWLERIKDVIIQSGNFHTTDLDLPPFTDRGGIDGAIRDLGPGIATVIDHLSRELTA